MTIRDFDGFILAIRDGITKAKSRFDKRLDVRVVFTVEEGKMVFCFTRVVH